MIGTTLMNYILTTATGRKMEFRVRACAELFRQIHGGVIAARS